MKTKHPSDFPESLERVDWKGVVALAKRRVPLKRSPLKRKPTKKRGTENPAYLAWLRTWPCFICMVEWGGDTFTSGERLAYVVTHAKQPCGPTEAAHVGVRGLAQKCPDRDAMPLGKKHHLHPTAGGGPESHHALGRKFWAHHGIDRAETLELLRKLYREETGKEI